MDDIHPEVILSQQFRQLLHNMHVDEKRYNRLLDEYVTNPEHGIPNVQMAQAHARRVLYQELASPAMSWLTFCKGLKVLQIKMARFALTSLDSDDLHCRTAIEFKL
jgi:uncharacterized protein YdcH (DUF465 family)